MGITDKISGRLKQAYGDVTGSRAKHAEGVREERKGEAKAEAERAEQEASRKRAEAADLDRKT